MRDDTEYEIAKKLRHRNDAPDFGLFVMIPETKARVSDPQTSKDAAASVAIRAGTAKAKLLLAHSQYPDGLIDHEAAFKAGINLRSEYATRCSELAKAGLLENTDLMRPDPDSGMQRMVRRITDAGREAVSKLDPTRFNPQPARLGRAEL